VIVVAQLEVVDLRKTSKLSLRMKWGIYIPSRNPAVEETWGRIIRPKLGQDYPACANLRPHQIIRPGLLGLDE
jgi:hypothetical protein